MDDKITNEFRDSILEKLRQKYRDNAYSNLSSSKKNRIFAEITALINQMETRPIDKVSVRYIKNHYLM